MIFIIPSLFKRKMELALNDFFFSLRGQENKQHKGNCPKFTAMELSLIYLLLAVIETTCNPFCEARSWKNPKLAKWYLPSAIMEGYTEDEDGTLYLNIDEDSNSINDLAKKVLSILNLTDDFSVQGISLTQVDSSRGRTRRAPDGIFGKDTRVNMRASLEAQMYPFSTAVMLSSGCTGTLIGAQHVLTAAHCVRNGKRLLKSAKHLKVGKYLSLTKAFDRGIFHLAQSGDDIMPLMSGLFFSVSFIVIYVSRLWKVRYVGCLNSKNPCVIPFHMVMISLMIQWLSFARGFETELDNMMCLLRDFGISV